MPVIPRRLRALARRIFQCRRAHSLSLSSRDSSYYTPSIVKAEPDHPSAGITPYPYTQAELELFCNPSHGDLPLVPREGGPFAPNAHTPFRASLLPNSEYIETLETYPDAIPNSPTPLPIYIRDVLPVPPPYEAEEGEITLEEQIKEEIEEYKVETQTVVSTEGALSTMTTLYESDNEPPVPIEYTHHETEVLLNLLHLSGEHFETHLCALYPSVIPGTGFTVDQLRAAQLTQIPRVPTPPTSPRPIMPAGPYLNQQNYNHLYIDQEDLLNNLWSDNDYRYSSATSLNDQPIAGPSHWSSEAHLAWRERNTLSPSSDTSNYWRRWAEEHEETPSEAEAISDVWLFAQLPYESYHSEDNSARSTPPVSLVPSHSSIQSSIRSASPQASRTCTYSSSISSR